MRRYSKFIVVAGTLAALTVPSVAMADAPNGNYPSTFKGNGTNSDGTLVGEYSSRSIQNGQFVSQQAQAGDRSANIQGYLGHTS
jgi:hypothetical protein